jgi:uncharacterized Fe-S cluster-containing radical SAM superfamily protein
MTEAVPRKTLDPLKFRDAEITAKGERRAAVTLKRLRTLWFNTGTLCNLTCTHCYIESSPTNDRLVYLSPSEVAAYLDELDGSGWGAEEIGFTGGEPFMNPGLIAMLDDVMRRGYRALVLTNAMRPMMKCAEELLSLRERYGAALVLRVSIDHYSQTLHETERGRRAWAPALAGLKWLSDQGFALHVAGRTMWGETEEKLRAGYARLFAAQQVRVDAHDRAALVLFPEMDAERDVPEITEACWGILGVDPDSVMCASSRMIIKRKGASRPAVVACTLLPYDPQFELGATLAESSRTVKLNHPYCAQFCVLGGGSCSARG